MDTYNNAMMRLFNLHFRCSTSEMFANSNIHCMDAMRRTCIYSFIQRLRCSDTESVSASKCYHVVLSFTLAVPHMYVHCMDEMRRICIYSFIQRLKCSSHAIITCFMSSTFTQKCAIWNHWFKCLYLHYVGFFCNI